MNKLLYKGSYKNVFYITLHYINKKAYNENEDKAIFMWVLKNITNQCNLDLCEILKGTKIYNVSNNLINYKNDFYTVHNDVIVIQEKKDKIYEIINYLLYGKTQIIPNSWEYVYNNIKYSFSELICMLGSIKALSSFQGSFTYKKDMKDDTENLYYKREIYDILKKQWELIPLEKEQVINIGTDSNNINSILDTLYAGETSSDNTITITLNDNYKDAFNDSKNKWIKINNVYEKRDEIRRFRNGLKLNAHFLLDSLILVDSNKSYNDIKDSLKDYIKIKPFSIIYINQLNLTSSMIEAPSYFKIPFGMSRNDVNCLYPSNALTIYLPNIDKISNFKLSSDYDFITENYNKYYSFAYEMKYDKKVKLYMIMTEPNKLSNLNYETIILPYKKNDNIHIKSLEALVNLYKEDDESKQSILKQQILSYIPQDEVDYKNKDILDIWFKQNIKNAKTDKEKLIKSYITLKRNLLKEYDNAKTYLDNINMKNKLPIPNIKTDKKGMKIINNKFKLISSKGSLDFINDKKLKVGLCYTYPKVLYMINKYNPTCKSVKLSKFYDKRNNSIYLNNKTLKEGGLD